MRLYKRITACSVCLTTVETRSTNKIRKCKSCLDQWYKEYRKKYYQKNKLKLLEQNKAYVEKYKKSKKGRATKAALEAARRAKIKKATPAWADLAKIRSFYQNCPDGYEVDHIIPLAGKEVCGLHVLENLQYLPSRENKKKGNKVNLEELNK